jgi:hypothetical protein
MGRARTAAHTQLIYPSALLGNDAVINCYPNIGYKLNRNSSTKADGKASLLDRLTIDFIELVKRAVVGYLPVVMVSFVQRTIISYLPIIVVGFIQCTIIGEIAAIRSKRGKSGRGKRKSLT